MTKDFVKRLVGLIKRAENGVTTVLAVMSMAAVALVFSTEFVSSDWLLPYFHWSWASVQVVSHIVIWLAFVTSFVIYSIVSQQPLKYLKTHILEFAICVTWVPQYSDGPFTMLTDIFVLSRFVPSSALQLVGTLIHAWRVLRWTAERFVAHPIYVVSAAAALLIFSSAALLTHFEPETFKTFWDGAWFTLVTVTTIGYGDLTPKTPTGRLITAFVIVGGISLFAVVIGLVSEFVRVKLLKQEANPEVAALRGKVRRLLGDMAKTRQMIERLESQNAEMMQLLRSLVGKNQADEKDPTAARNTMVSANVDQPPSAGVVNQPSDATNGGVDKTGSNIDESDPPPAV